MSILGIDISKRDFHAFLIVNNAESKKSFPNTLKGFAQLDAWLKNRKAVQVHACMEATGAYWEALALHLHEAQHRVSVVNPMQTKAFAQSEMLRAKTDSVDAAMIARFCKTQEPSPWEPLAPEFRLLQALSRHLTALKDQRAEYLVRMQNPQLPVPVIDSLQSCIEAFDREIRDIEKQINDHIDQNPNIRNQHELLISIPGIASTTATSILAEIPNLSDFCNAKQVAAYAGLSPLTKQSGTSVRGRGAICRMGNSRVRRALYFPAMSARRWNPVFEVFSARLKSAGKRPMVIVCAMMRKLLVLAWAILRTGKPFQVGIMSAQRPSAVVPA